MNVVALKKWLWQSRYLWIFLVPLFIMLPKAQAHDNATTSAQSPDIIGGQEADIGEYPWQAELQTSDSLGGSYLCGATLIRPNWVMTAAHCVYDSQSGGLMTVDKVVLGAHNINLSSEPNRQTFTAKQVIIHANYNPGTTDNDIALIELSGSAQLNDYVAVIDLASSPLDDSLMTAGTSSTVTGWGQTGNSGASSSVLMEVSVPLVDQSTCETVYNEIGEQVTMNMICAGDKQGGKDSCRGDSGGPLIVDAGNGSWKQVGIVSWGYYPCAQADFYGVYTRVANYSSWISVNLGENTNTPEPTATTTPTRTPKPAVTATATATPSLTPTTAPTVTPGPSPTPFANLLKNSDFEAVDTPAWQVSSSQTVEIISKQSAVAPASGEYVAQLGVIDNEESRLWQTIELPAEKSLYLIFDYAIVSTEAGCFRDLGKIYVGQERIAQYILCADTGTLEWQHEVLDIKPYAGKTLNLQFYARNNASDPSGFYLDNVRLASMLEADEIATEVVGVNDGGAGQPGANILGAAAVYLPLISR